MILERLQDILRDVLDHENLEITENTKHTDVEEWDSLATINIIVAVSEEFHIKVGIEEVEHFKDVRSIITLIESKQGSGENNG